MSANAQKRDKYEFSRNLPVYADSLLNDLTYPLAWGNSSIRDFNQWKQVARQRVFDCMLPAPPPPAKGYEAKVLFEEQRDGYPGVEKAFNIMHDVWRSQGVDDRLVTELWDMPHSCPREAQRRAMEFFKKHLR